MKRLEQLTDHPDDAVASAARATLEYCRKYEPFDARSFDKVYVEILRQGRTLSLDRQLAEWRMVRDVSRDLYRSLLWEFRATRLRRAGPASVRKLGQPAEA